MKLSKDARYSTTIGEINQQIDDWHAANELDENGKLAKINADEFWRPAREIQEVNENIKRLNKQMKGDSK